MPSPSSIRRPLAVLFAGLVLLTTGFLAFAASAMGAEPRPLAMASSDPAFTLTESADAVVLTPARPTPTGLVFVSGAQVEPAA